MTELRVNPYRAANENLLNQYYSLLYSFPNPELGGSGFGYC